MIWAAASPISYRELFWLLEPELSTRIFIGLVGPFPVADFRKVVSMFANVLLVLDELVAQELLEMPVDGLQPRHAVDHVARQMKAVEIVQHGHIERRGGRAFFFVSAHVKIVVVRAPVGEAMDQRRDSRDRQK